MAGRGDEGPIAKTCWILLLITTPRPLTCPPYSGTTSRERFCQLTGTAIDDVGSAIEAGGSNNSQTGQAASGNLLRNDTGDQGGTVVAIRVGDVAGLGNAGTIGLPLRGRFGNLTVQANGRFVYSPDDNDVAVNALPAGGRLLDSFNYTRLLGGTYQAAILRVSIDGANDSPRLLTDSIAFDPIAANTALPEGPAGRVGTVVSALAVPRTGSRVIADVDDGSTLGLAVTAADQSKGTWWFSLDDGGTWQRMGGVSATTARMLPASARLFFRPNRGIIGDLPQGLTLRAWDQTVGVAGQLTPMVDLGNSLSATSGQLNLRIDVPRGTRIDFDTIAGTTAVAPSGDLLVNSSATTVRTVTGIAGGARVTTLGSGALRLLASNSDLTLARGGSGTVTISGLAAGAKLSVETSFGTVSFASDGRLLTGLAPSQMAIKRSVRINGTNGRITFTITGTL